MKRANANKTDWKDLNILNIKLLKPNIKIKEKYNAKLLF